MYIFLSPDNRPQTQNVRPESLAIFPNYQPGSEVKKFPDHQCWNEAKNVTNLDFLLHYICKVYFAWQTRKINDRLHTCKQYWAGVLVSVKF